MDDLDYSSTSSDEMDHSNFFSPLNTDEFNLYVIVINGSVKLKNQPNTPITFQPGENISFENFIAKLHQAFPFLKNDNYYLTYKDDAGDRREISNDEDLEETMGGVEDEDGGYLLLYALYDSDVDKSTADSFPSQYYCDRCCYALKHFRYICKTCLEYDLCKDCKDENVHGFHEFEKLDIVTSENAPLLEINEIHIWSKYRIDEGAFGFVYTAYERTTNRKIAVKFFKDFVGDGPEITDRFSRELAVYKVAGEHNNFVKVLGFCRDSYNFGLAMEYVTMTVNGNEISGLIMYLMLLRKLFKSGRKHDIDRKELDSFALQISRGMEHLEIRGVVHRNLAARNVLIDRNKNLKISDFGLSHSRVEYDIFGSRWSAPEILRHGNYSSKSDVWAFGVVLWEIATLGGSPYDWLDNENVKSYVKGGGRLRKPPNMSDRLYRIMSRCWAGRPENRPNFSDLVNKFLDFKWLPYCFDDFDDDDDFELPAALELYERRVRFM